MFVIKRNKIWFSLDYMSDDGERLYLSRRHLTPMGGAYRTIFYSYQ